MLKNNIELDVKTKCIEDRVTQAQVAEQIGITKSYVNKIVRNREQIVNRTFISMMEALGYDVKLVYEKRDTAEQNRAKIGDSE